MSSVLIKGMKMPKECRECPFVEYSSLLGNTWCKATAMIMAQNFKPIEFDGRHESCPLVEIPVPHGDLIDKEKLYNTTVDLEAQALAQTEKLIHSEDISEWKRWSATLNERTAFKHDLLDAQIVIEAEEDQNEE
jgi:hypothetical protein